MDSDGYNGQILEHYRPGWAGPGPSTHPADRDRGAQRPGRPFLRENPGIYIQGGIDKRELRFGKEQARPRVARR